MISNLFYPFQYSVLIQTYLYRQQNACCLLKRYQPIFLMFLKNLYYFFKILALLEVTLFEQQYNFRINLNILVIFQLLYFFIVIINLNEFFLQVDLLRLIFLFVFRWTRNETKSELLDFLAFIQVNLLRYVGFKN